MSRLTDEMHGDIQSRQYLFKGPEAPKVVPDVLGTVGLGYDGFGVSLLDFRTIFTKR
jgi:hypothetical protein